MVLLVMACGGKGEPPVATTAEPAASDPRAAAFWRWFTEHADALRADTDIVRTMERISAELAAIDREVFAEIGAAGDKRTLVLSADGNKERFPLVQALYASRPTVPGWTIVAFRQRAKPGDSFRMNDLEIDAARVKMIATRAGPKVDLAVFLPVDSGATDVEMSQIGSVILAHVVGEYDLTMKIGATAFAPLERAPTNAQPLTDLPAVVDALR